MKIRFKVSSCTSESPSNPVLNLVSGVSEWESARFCTYPQQITLMFYQPIMINKIKIVASQTKVPEKINILYHLPTVENQNQFTKLGFVSFKALRQQLQDSNSQIKRPLLRQLKVIKNIQLKAQYLRLIISKNHASKTNFFNQVGVSSIQIQGTGFQINLGSIQLKNDSIVQLTNYTKDKLALLYQFKQKCIQKEQYNQANQIKEIIGQVHELIEDIRVLNQEKIKLIHQQNYIEAKQIKQQINEIKSKIQHISNNFYDPKKKTINKFDIEKLIKNKSKHKIDNSANNQYDNQFLKQKSQNNQQEAENGSKSQINDNEIQQSGEYTEPFSHEQKIVPAVLNKLKNSDIRSDRNTENEELQNSKVQQTLPDQPQQLSPSNQANASVLTEFFDKMTIRKLHSKYWQFKNQALEQVKEDCKKPTNNSMSKNKLRAYLFIYNRITSKQNNKQFILSAIQILNSVTGAKIAQSDFKTQLTRQLEKSVLQTLDKTQEGQNPKVKSQAQKLVLKMIESSVFGMNLIYHSIIKAYNDKLSSKIKKIYLQSLQNVVNNSHGNLKNNIPQSIVDFTVKKCNDPSNQVRKKAINLLKALKKNGYQDRIKICLAQQKSIKQSYLKQLKLQ